MSEYYAPTLNSLYFALKQAVRDSRCNCAGAKTTRDECRDIADDWSRHRQILGKIEGEISEANGRLEEIRNSRDDDLIVAAGIVAAAVVPIGRALGIVRTARAIVSVAELGGSLGELAAAAAGLAGAADLLDEILESTRKIEQVKETLRGLASKLDDEDAVVNELHSRYFSECAPLRPS